MDVLIPLQLQRKELYMAAEEKNNNIQAISEKRTYSVQELRISCRSAVAWHTTCASSSFSKL